ncbi:MAG: hypothetical protein AAFN78_02625 [Pseudomonadota bacterium]
MTAKQKTKNLHRAPLLATATIMMTTALIPQSEARVGQPLERLDFMTPAALDLPQQDVFVEREPGSGMVYRASDAERNSGMPLFASAEGAAHNPFDPALNQPFPKGEALGLTLADWQNHKGVASYACSEGRGTLRAEFSGLVPGGVYSLWHAYLATPSSAPASGQLDLPVTGSDGEAGVFVADANGDATATVSFDECLPRSDRFTTSMLAVNWHSDGQASVAVDGSYGRTAHVPLFLVLPSEGAE